MKAFVTLLGKETRALFSSPIAYIVIAVYLLLVGYTFTASLFMTKMATLIHIFFQASVLLLLMIPIITMRQFSEERRQGTLELLLTAPVREVAIVLAKFGASMAIVLVMIGLTLSYAVVLGLYGTPDWGPIYSGYLGLVLIGSSLTALGLMLSAMTANQIVAAVVSLGLFSLLWMLDSIAAMLPDPFDRILIGLSLLAHFTPLATGAMYTSDFGFFFSVTLLGLFLAVRALARR
ncbi:MAG: ABC transporter permease subunit [Betaproteobacteria bacterium]|nr:ABC transporter permease subunit [Betaproteobacteria bacterium]